MEQLIKTVDKLVREECCLGDNREEIQQEIIEFLVKNKETECEVLLKSLFESVKHKSYEYEVDKIVISVREKTVDEQKLFDKGVIIDAKSAREISDICAEKIRNIEYSGLSKLKRATMIEIREQVLIGKTEMISNLRYHDYDSSLELIDWLKKLGFAIERMNFMCYRISW